MGSRFTTRRRLTAVASLAALALAAGTAPALGHAEFAEPSSVPANSDQRLTLHAPEERGPSVRTEKVAAQVPAGFAVHGCAAAGSFTCTRSAGRSGATILTWTRQGGNDVVEDFAFEVHTPTRTGRYAFKVNQSYADGSTDHWDGPEASEFPAAVLEVTG
jgi:hypothetical protein